MVYRIEINSRTDKNRCSPGLALARHASHHLVDETPSKVGRSRFPREKKSTCGDNRHIWIQWHQWCALGEMVERGDKEQGQLVNGILKLGQSVHPVGEGRSKLECQRDKRSECKEKDCSKPFCALAAQVVEAKPLFLGPKKKEVGDFKLLHAFHHTQLHPYFFATKEEKKTEISPHRTKLDQKEQAQRKSTQQGTHMADSDDEPVAPRRPQPKPKPRSRMGAKQSAMASPDGAPSSSSTNSGSALNGSTSPSRHSRIRVIEDDFFSKAKSYRPPKREGKKIVTSSLDWLRANITALRDEHGSFLFPSSNRILFQSQNLYPRRN